MAEGARGATAARTGRWMRDALVVVEVALALVVLIGAGLLLRSFVRLRATHLGFGPEGVLTYRMPMAGGRNSTPARATAFLDQALAHIGGLPGVRAAAAVNALPLTGLGTGVIFTIDGRPAPSPGERPIALIRFVTRDYFRAMAHSARSRPRICRFRYRRIAARGGGEPRPGTALLARRQSAGRTRGDGNRSAAHGRDRGRGGRR